MVQTLGAKPANIVTEKRADGVIFEAAKRIMADYYPRRRVLGWTSPCRAPAMGARTTCALIA